MTLNKTLTIFMVLVCTILFSCKKDEDTKATPTPTVDTTEYFTCKLNTVAYVDDARFADYTSTTTSRVVSQNADELVRLNINGQAVGTYTISSSSTANAIIYVDANGNQYNSISGSIIVTEYSKTNQIISGTFTGVLKKTTDNTQITVTEGKFNYIELLPF